VPPRFLLRIWGARGSCPSPGASTLRYGGNTACIEVRSADGDVIVLDAGTGIRALGNALQREANAPTTHLYLTHRHADHVIGLPHFQPLFVRDRRILLRCGNADAIGIQQTLSVLLSPPLFPALEGIANSLDIAEFDADARAMVSANVHVRMLPARHPGGAAIFVVSDEAGPVLAYAPDNELAYASNDFDIGEWRGQLAQSLQGIPILVHDAMYRGDELTTHVGWGHSSAEEATRFALECNAGALLLFHHHPERDDIAIDDMVDACRAVVADAGSTMRVEAAHEGMEISV
jgi:phosphoribosyl 1,2-cyclic phosphodiesterase